MDADALPDALPTEVIEALGAGTVDLDGPSVTLTLLGLGSSHRQAARRLAQSRPDVGAIPGLSPLWTTR